MGLVAAGCLTMGAAPLSGEEKGKASPYFPLQVGTQWHYRLGDEQVRIQVARHEKVGDEWCAVLESVQDGIVIETETVAVRGDGLYRIATDDGKLNPPLLFFRLPPRKGDSWPVKFKVNGEASVSGTFVVDQEVAEVPAGKFAAVVTHSKDFEADGIKFTMASWYASGVGPVKKLLRAGPLEMVLELERFEPAR
jgi:hypothetical protein